MDVSRKEYDQLVLLASWMVVLWPVGVPLFFSALLWRVRTAISSSGAPTTPFAAAIGILYREYDPSVYWWEVVELLRRLVLVGFLQFVPSAYTVFRQLIAIWLSILFLALQLIVRPYRRSDDNALAAFASIILVASLFAGMLIHLNDEFSDEWSAEGTIRVLGMPSSYSIAVVMIICCAVFLGLVVYALARQAFLKARSLRRKQADEDRELVSDAIASTRRMLHPCVLLSYERFVALGRLVPHEELRDRGLLKVVDDYDELRKFAEATPIAFCSHEWLGVDEPDPKNVHFQAMVQALSALCTSKGVDASQLYVWCDYFSVPQVSRALQQLAIETLSSYATSSRYFLIIAPPALKEGFGTRDAETYARRGWCRLEQFSRLASLAHDSILMYDGQRDGQEPLQPVMSGDKERVARAAAVFEGDFTVEADRERLVKTVLGLYARILERRECPEMARLYEAIQEDKQSIFPPMFFRKMPAMMEERVEANQRGGELERKMGWLSALWKARPRVAPRVMPAKRTA